MKRRQILIILVVASGLLVCLPKAGNSETMGTAFTYQGRLIDVNELADGLYDFRFKLFDSAEDGNQLNGDVNIPDLDIIDGYFTVELDFGGGLFDGNSVWLDIGIRPGEMNDPNLYTALSPRQLITPTPYALYAKMAGSGGSGDNDWMVSGNDMYSIPPGEVGIGTTSPSSKLHIEDNTDGSLALTIHNLDDSGSERIRFGTGSGSDAGIIVWGSANASYPGKWRFFNNKTTGHYDWVTGGSIRMALTSDGSLGIGTTSPTSKLEVITTENEHGIRSTVPYIAVYGHRTGTSGTWPAIHGECDSQSSNASGVRGYITSTSPGSNSAGVYGYNYGTGSNGVGVRGYHAGSGTGIYGECTNGKGVYGVSTNGYAGYFTGGKNYFGGDVGIGTTSPDAELDVYGTRNISATSDGIVNIGSSSSYHVTIDKNEIHGRNGSSASNLYINDFGGNVLIAKNGNVGIGTSAPVAKLTVRGGNLLIENSSGTDIVELGEGLDYAEGFDVSDKSKITSGSVLVIDSENPGKLAMSNKAYDNKVAGIVAGAKGMGSGVRLGSEQFDYDVALAGRVYCNVDATEAAVQPGDFLTTSATSGYAMKAADYTRAQGAILGKAMEKLEKGKKGQILVLVTLQ